ncbi:unnamed protein product [Diamesa tonsa]
MPSIFHNKSYLVSHICLLDAHRLNSAFGSAQTGGGGSTIGQVSTGIHVLFGPDSLTKPSLQKHLSSHLIFTMSQVSLMFPQLFSQAALPQEKDFQDKL